MPSDAEINLLVKNSVMVFVESIKQKDLTIFYNKISQLRQEQTTPIELQQAFQVFIDNQIDFSSILGVEPQYSALPEMDNNGILLIR
jgi:hypothetical protein